MSKPTPLAFQCCETCIYWLDSQCHRYPPIRDVTDDSREGAYGLWPETLSGDWCGEWKRGPAAGPES